MKPVALFWKIFRITLLVSTIIYFGIPGQRDYLLKEDSFIENISAFLYFSTALYALYLLFFVRRKVRSVQQKTRGIILLCAASFLCFLEEISFGERLFNLKMPYVGTVKIDAFHDWLDVLYRVVAKPEEAFPAYVPFLLFTSIAVAIALLFKFRSQLRRIKRNAQSDPSSALAIIFVWLIALSLLMDLEIIGGPAMVALEELFEMNAAVALLICGLSLRRAPSRHGQAAVAEHGDGGVRDGAGAGAATDELGGI